MASELDYATLSDGVGTFSVRSDGRIEVLSGYPTVGTIYKPGSATYDQVVKNLARARPGNKETIAKVIGAHLFVQAMSTPDLPAATGGGAAPMEELAVPFYRKTWFVPAVLGVGVVGAIGFILLRKKR